nr:Actin cytoskeleton-regulatory complex protein [Ipomoea batatas]
MAAAASRGAHSMNFSHFKPMVRKASYHRKSGSPEMMNETVKLNGEEAKSKKKEETWWIPDNRTGIFYPKGQNKVIEEVPPAAGRDVGPINWFSNHEDSL